MFTPERGRAGMGHLCEVHGWCFKRVCHTHWSQRSWHVSSTCGKTHLILFYTPLMSIERIWVLDLKKRHMSNLNTVPCFQGIFFPASSTCLLPQEIEVKPTAANKVHAIHDSNTPLTWWEGQLKNESHRTKYCNIRTSMPWHASILKSFLATYLSVTADFMRPPDCVWEVYIVFTNC